MEIQAKNLIEEVQQSQEDELEFLRVDAEFLQIKMNFYENQSKLFGRLIHNQEVEDKVNLKEYLNLADKLNKRDELVKKLKKINDRAKVEIKPKDEGLYRLRVTVNIVFPKVNGFFNCSECPYKSKFHGRIESHVVDHHKLKPWKCLERDCGKGFTTKIYLASHQKRIHSLQKDFVCDICNCRFALKVCLKEHLQIHLPPSFFCSKCDKKFVFARDLKKHFKIHQGILNEICKHCNKKFVFKNTLASHILNHHFLRIQCEVPGCLTTFGSKAKYKRHLKRLHKAGDKILIDKLLKKLEKLKPDYKKLKYV